MALQHPWIANHSDGVVPEVDKEIIHSLTSYTTPSKIKHEAMRVFIIQLPSSEL